MGLHVLAHEVARAASLGGAGEARPSLPFGWGGLRTGVPHGDREAALRRRALLRAAGVFREPRWKRMPGCTSSLPGSKEVAGSPTGPEEKRD